MINGKEELITSTNYRNLMKNNDRKTRKEIREKYLKVLSQYAASSAQFLDSYIKEKIAICKIRKHKTCYDAKLFNYNMSSAAFDTLVKTVEKNNTAFQKYLKMFKRVHKLDKLYSYDLELDFAKSEKKYSVEEAEELCLNAVRPLGEEYYNCFKKIFDNKYIDYAEYKGKRSGAYSFATNDKDSRILMSYNYDLESVSTIIHEGGHNVNHQYLKEFNSKQYVGNASINAEVTSLLNECLLSNYIVENAKTKEEKLMGLENILGVIVSNLFGAVREGKLEEDFYKIVHKNGTITREYLDKMTKKSLKKYYGNSVKLDKYSKNGWITRSHYFMNFYLYSYAISISVASSIANKIINGDKETLDKYIDYLKCGSNMWPEDAFNVLGVNIEDENVYLDAIKYFDSLIDKYYEILGE
jgi:oligoendopeptidase F